MKRSASECLCGLAAATALCLALSASAAERLFVDSLGTPTLADRETSATFALPALDGQNWRLTLALPVTPSNRVDAALGFDADGDGALGADETGAVVGVEGLSWTVLGGDGLEERWTAAAVGGTLVIDIRLALTGGVERVTFRDGGGAVTFAGFPQKAPFLNPAAWNAVRLTARGGGVRAEAAAIASFADGTHIILK